MADDGKRRARDSDDSAKADEAARRPPLEDDTVTTELVKAERGTDAPFALPHVSQLDEATPRDARKDLVTMPAYGLVAPPQTRETRLNPPPRQAADMTELSPRRNAAPMPAERSPAPPQFAAGRQAPLGDSIKLARKSRRKRRFLGLPLGCVGALAALMLSVCGGLTLLTVGAAMIFLPQVEAEWSARVAAVDNYRGFESSFIYDRHGKELYELFGEGRRTRVSYDRIPDALKLATIAIEDDSFFRNIGIDLGHTVLAALNYLGAADRESAPGGSTITQQLVRNIFFDFEKRAERSVKRKAEEILLAIVMTQSRSKEDILEMYFNEIYYGNLAYGVQTAAQTFFGKNVDELGVGEAAMLAGLPQAPAWLDPLNPDPAVQAAVDERWRQVLSEMAEEGFISQQQVKEALREGLSFAPANTSLTGAPFHPSTPKASSSG